MRFKVLLRVLIASSSDKIKAYCHGRGWACKCVRCTVFTTGVFLFVQVQNNMDKHDPGYLMSTHQRTFLLFLDYLVLRFVCLRPSYAVAVCLVCCCLLPPFGFLLFKFCIVRNGVFWLESEVYFLFSLLLKKTLEPRNWFFKWRPTPAWQK